MKFFSLLSIAEADEGINVAPIHPNCGCTIETAAPEKEAELKNILKRMSDDDIYKMAQMYGVIKSSTPKGTVTVVELMNELQKKIWAGLSGPNSEKVGDEFNGVVKYLKTGDKSYIMEMDFSLEEPGDQSGQLKVETLDFEGLNMIANMERNLSMIKYDLETGVILSIPTILPDVGYGHDVNQRPMNPIPDSLTAKEALELLKNDMKDFEKPIATGINAVFTQNQFNALVSLRYNIGSLGVVNGLLEYLESGSYERAKLRSLVISYYDAKIIKKPANEKYRQGWYNRTEKFLDIFFDGSYGNMPIDAVNGMAIFK